MARHSTMTFASTLQAGASSREADAEPMDEDAKQAASAKVVKSLGNYSLNLHILLVLHIACCLSVVAQS